MLRYDGTRMRVILLLLCLCLVKHARFINYDIKYLMGKELFGEEEDNSEDD